MSEPIHQTDQEDILTLLCFYDKAGKKIADDIDATYFSDTYRPVAERILDYWREYNEAPQNHISNLLADLVDNPRKAKTYQRILSSLRDNADRVSTRFVTDRLRAFKHRQLAQAATLKFAEDVARGDRPIGELTDEFRVKLDGIKADSGRKLTTRSLDQFERRDVQWLWWPFVPRRMLTLMFGDGDVGKSTITIDMAARISKGRPWPVVGNAEEETPDIGSVLILTHEDDPESIIRPRLEAAKADLSRVHMVGYDVPDDVTDFDPIDQLDKTIPDLERRIQALGDVRAIIIDPILDFTGKIDSNRPEAAREWQKPLRALARRFDLAVIGISHINKKNDLPVIQRALGSGAFTQVPRSGLFVVEDPLDAQHKVMVTAKRNLLPQRYSLGFTMKTVGHYARVIWDQDWDPRGPEELIARGKDASAKRDQAEELLLNLLADGPVFADDCFEAAKEAGISETTLKRAKKKLGIKVKKDGRGSWRWQLPERGSARGSEFLRG